MQCLADEEEMQWLRVHFTIQRHCVGVCVCAMLYGELWMISLRFHSCGEEWIPGEGFQVGHCLVWD